MNIDNLELYMELINLERLLRAENAKAARLYGPLSDVSHGQGRILAYLKYNEPVSVKELAKELNIRPQSLQDHLRHMERDGLIERNRSEIDSRIKLISLTPQARDIEQNQRSYEGIFKGLSEEELENLYEYVNIIKNNLMAELGESYLEELPPGPPPKAHRRPIEGEPPVLPHLRHDRPLHNREEELPPHLRYERPHRPGEEELHRKPPRPGLPPKRPIGARPKPLHSEPIEFKLKPGNHPIPEDLSSFNEEIIETEQEFNQVLSEFQDNFKYLTDLLEQLTMVQPMDTLETDEEKEDNISVEIEPDEIPVKEVQEDEIVSTE